MISKIIFQTWKDDKFSPNMEKAILSWKDKNPNFEYQFFTDEQCLKFIRSNFGVKEATAFMDLLPGAFKADLFRLCVLYVYGGVYADIDTICLESIEPLLSYNVNLIVCRDDPMAKKWLWNGFIASSPNHPMLKIAISKILANVESKENKFYLDYTGPGLVGKALNQYLGEPIENDYNLGLNTKSNVLILQHNNGHITKDDKQILRCEYPEKGKDNLPSYFWDNIQKNRIFRQIPRKIIYTTLDELTINDYMVDSFKKHNPEYELLYFDQYSVDKWFENTEYNEFYKTLNNRGEISDFFRYCYLYENGGVYSDADTYCNQPLDNWITYQDIIFGLEGNVIKEGFFKDNFFGIGYNVENRLLSVCNWTIASAPKHPLLKQLINDIINNPKHGVIVNTGPGRLTNHVIEYFGTKQDYTKHVTKDNSMCFSINAFGSNQSHSGAKKYDNPFDVKDKDIYVTHMFAGTWRNDAPKPDIKVFKQNDCSHNLSIWETKDGYKGIARRDEDTSRTLFMKQLGDCRSLYEFDFNADMTLKDTKIRNIKYDKLSKWEDYRTVVYKGKPYHFASYIDENWNTTTAILDENYIFIKQLQFDEPNKMAFIGDKEVTWYKNLLPFVHNDELHFIYNTSPRYKVYKHTGDWEFEKIIDVENHLHDKFPQDELYFTAACKVGGSTAPIWFEDEGVYMYIVHTKLYSERRYNHYVVKLDKDLNLIDVSFKPFITKKVPYALFFISTWLREDDYVLLSGGVEDNANFTWKIPVSKLLKCF